MPKINAPSIIENRAMRRDELIDAAARLMIEQGTVSMTTVAREVGLSRSALYEYYSSAADLIADVLVDELAAWTDDLASAVNEAGTCDDQVRAWINAVFAYAADGRHALVRAAGRTPLPPVRRAQVQAMHQSLAEPLVTALGGDERARYLALYIWAVAEAAINSMDQGADSQEQADLAWGFCQAGLSALR
jgi:AcrR family transcriptional regulator